MPQRKSRGVISDDPSAGAFGGLLAFGIGQLDHTWGYRGWRFIYVIEGLVSLVVALAAYFWIQKTPEQQGGWLTPEEQRYLVLRGRYGYGSDKLGSKDEFNWRDARAAAKVSSDVSESGRPVAGRGAPRPPPPLLTHSRST